MAQTGYTPLSLYYSTTASAAPTAGNLANGELAININDGKLYYKDNLGAVQLIASKAGSLGSVTSVDATFTGGIVSVGGVPITSSGTIAFTVAGTSGGIPYFSSTSAWASSALLTANALMVGGGAGTAPSTVTTGTGVVTALGVNTGSAGAFVVNGGDLGTPSGGTVTNLTGTASININGSVGATTPNTGSFTSLTDSGNLTFTGTGNRITGDFSNATVANRVMFQTSTVNANTNVQAIPNGTAVNGGFLGFNNSDPTNAAFIGIATTGGTEARLTSGITGTGTYLPMTFYTGGSERMRIDTSGNVLVGGTAARGTTVGAAHLDLFNGTAPAGTLTNGISLYSSSGDFSFMDSAGNGYKVGFRNVPAVGTKTGSYTLAVADVGKYVQVGSGGSITIPDATFAEGDVISIFNNTSGNITITCSITTAYISGVDTDKATMTLATRGIATVFFISGTVCVVTGSVS